MNQLCQKLPEPPNQSAIENGGTVHNRGLSSNEAAAQYSKCGPNTFDSKQRTSWISNLLDRLKNPLVCILLAASGISFVTGETASFIIIFTVICISIALDMVQQSKADKAVEALSKSVALNACVIRDGKECTISTAEIVPGDIVTLAAGDLIPADGILVEANHLFIDQSALSGESFPVEKCAQGTVPASLTKENLTSEIACFAGSSVSSGTGLLQVHHTGKRTIFGDLSASLASRREATSFDVALYDFGRLILRFTLLLVSAVLIVNIACHKPVLDSLLFSVALAVGLTPELLPMIVTVTLTGGALKMSRKKVIVKRLSAVQDLGSMEVLCTDKTGTLTVGKIELYEYVDATGCASEEVLRIAYLNSAFETGIKSPLDQAILRSDNDQDLSQYNKLDELPFDFKRRRVSILLDNKEQCTLAMKGAFTEVLSCCTRISIAGQIEDIQKHHCAVEKQFENLAKQGFHILAIARKDLDQYQQSVDTSDENNFIFLGFAAFLDPPKPTAALALKELENDGVSIKILSGDHELVAQHVCAALNYPVRNCLSGDRIANMSDRDLLTHLEETNLFCRVDPGQKKRIISLIKSTNKVVGFLGDGINDAPSLHAADVGISVDTAVDVAKQAADLVLLEQDLSVLHEGLREGRKAFLNVHKYIMMATSSNFGNMVSMAAGSLFLPFLPMLPVQVLLNNLLYDLSELALPTDNVDEELLHRPCKENISAIQRFMVLVGPISSVFDFVTFFVLITLLKANETLFQSGWFLESLATQILVIFVIRTKRKIWDSAPSKILVAASATTLATACLFTQSKWNYFAGLTALPTSFFAMLGFIAASYLAIVSIVCRRLKLSAE